MESVQALIAGLLQPLVALFHPSAPLSIYYIAGAALFSAGFFFVLRRRAGWRRFKRFLLPASVYLHPSARLDYRFYVVNGAFGALALTALIATSAVWNALTLGALNTTFGPAAPAGETGWLLRLATAALAVVAFDFGYWVSHWLLHKSPVLWEFHKIHHSAEVLTPATTWRQHPVEELLVSNLVAIPVGATYAAMTYAFGAQELTLLHVNAVLVVYYFTFFHLRHSHIWLPVRGWLGRVIQSPAHHQLHHSDDPRHMGKNLGFCLSVWDWAFGTLYVPEKRERLRFGIGPESKDYNSCVRLYALPFTALARRFRRPSVRPAAAPEAAVAPPG